MEYFNRTDKENQLNIPLEFQINEIDERFEFFSSYNDGDYNTFVTKAKNIIKNYKTYCNSDNKKLLLLSNKCQFSPKEMHGGFECGDDGKLSDKCVPSYCVNGYYFDETKNECIKDLCIKYEEEIETNKLIYTILFSVFCSLFGLLLIFYLLCTCCDFQYDFCQKKKYHWLCIPLVIFLILFALFLGLFLKEKYVKSPK